MGMSVNWSRLSLTQKTDNLNRWKAGQSLHEIGRAYGEAHGSPGLLLGEIQYAQGNHREARQTRQKLIDDLPSDPAARTAKHKLETSAPGVHPKNP